jgi:hypothetical protein
MIPTTRPLPPTLELSSKVCEALRDVIFDRGPTAVTCAWELSTRARVDLADVKPVVERVAACGAPVRLVVDGAWIRLAGQQP